MATVTQLSSGSIFSGTSISLTGITFDDRDVLIFFSSSYMRSSAFLGLSSITGSVISNNDFIFSNTFGAPNTGSSPRLFGAGWYGYGQRSVSGQTVTANFQSSNPAAVIVYRLRPDYGKQIVFRRATMTNFSNLAATSRTMSTELPMTSDSVIVGAFAVADNTLITDSDTFNGSWSSVFYVDSTAGTDLAVFGQSKIVTGAGQQTYGGSWANGQSERSVGFLFEFYEIGLPHWGIMNL